MFNNTTTSTAFMNLTTFAGLDRSAYKAHINVWFGVSLLFCAFGGLANLLVFCIICSSTTLRTGSGTLIAHLLLIEFFICSVIFPINQVTLFLQNSTYNTCKIMQCATNTLLTSGYWSTLCLAVNRFVAIIFPFAYKFFSSKHMIICMIVCSWAVSIVVNLLGFLSFFGTYVNLGRVWPGCALRSTLAVGGVPFHVIIGVYIPMGIVGIVYVFIFAQSLLFQCGLFNNGEISPNARRLAVTRMLFFSFVLYCVCYLPLMIFQRPYYNEVSFKLLPLGIFVWWLGTIYVAGYAINPVLILLLSKDYNSKLASFLGFRSGRNAVQNLHVTERQQRRGVQVRPQTTRSATTRVTFAAPTQY